jgi:hypothetical protein
MPTSTPPPYFPQNSLIPPDPNRWKKIRLGLFGCLALALLLAAGGVYLLLRAFR